MSKCIINVTTLQQTIATFLRHRIISIIRIINLLNLYNLQ